MTFLEQELQKIFGKDMGLSDIRIVGNACYGRLSGAVSDYLDVFREPVQEPQMGQEMC